MVPSSSRSPLALVLLLAGCGHPAAFTLPPPGVLPFPVELLRFLEKAQQSPHQDALPPTAHAPYAQAQPNPAPYAATAPPSGRHRVPETESR